MHMQLTQFGCRTVEGWVERRSGLTHKHYVCRHSEYWALYGNEDIRLVAHIRIQLPVCGRQNSARGYVVPCHFDKSLVQNGCRCTTRPELYNHMEPQIGSTRNDPLPTSTSSVLISASPFPTKNVLPSFL